MSARNEVEPIISVDKGVLIVHNHFQSTRKLAECSLVRLNIEKNAEPKVRAFMYCTSKDTIVTRVEGGTNAILCEFWNEVSLRANFGFHETAIKKRRGQARYVMAIFCMKFFLVKQTM